MLNTLARSLCRLSTNLILYLTRVMGQESGHAALQVSLFEGTCYLTPLLGAWLADSRWGRYKTIMVFSIIYFLVCACVDRWAGAGRGESYLPFNNVKSHEEGIWCLIACLMGAR